MNHHRHDERREHHSQHAGHERHEGHSPEMFRDKFWLSDEETFRPPGDPAGGNAP